MSEIEPVAAETVQFKVSIVITHQPSCMYSTHQRTRERSNTQWSKYKIRNKSKYMHGVRFPVIIVEYIIIATASS